MKKLITLFLIAILFSNCNTKPNYTKNLATANYEALTKLAIEHSDGLIMASENLPEAVAKEIKGSKKLQLNFAESKDEEVYIEFYSKK